MHSTHNAWKSFVVEKYIRNLKKKEIKIYDFEIKTCEYW